MKQDNKEKLSELNKEIDAIRYKAIKGKIQKMEIEVERLTNQKFYNPYDVLLLDGSASDQQIKKQYKAFALILHPDRIRDKDPKAKDAWLIVQGAYKTLLDQQKRKVYLRVMRQARERTEFERQKQNKKRIKAGQHPMPDSTFNDQYQQTCLNIFKDLESKKDHIIKIQQSQFTRKVEELETKKMIEQFRILTEEEWERSRDKRVSNWRDFSKQKFVVGSRRSDGAIRPPPVKAQDRPSYSIIEDKKKNI